MDARLIRTPFRRSLVARPRHQALGVLIPDVLIGLFVARTTRVPLVFLRSKQGTDSPLLYLVAEGVSRIDGRFVRSSTASRAWTLLLACFRFKDGLRSPRNHVISATIVVIDVVGTVLASGLRVPRRLRRAWNQAVGHAQAWCGGGVNAKLTRRVPWRLFVSGTLERWKVGKFDRSKDPREWALTARARFSTRLEASRRRTPPGREVHHGYDIRRLSAEHPVRVQFSAVDDAEARAVMRSLGLVDVPLVTLHVREGGSKRSEPRDAARDASIETCLPAVDELVQRGFTVVRIGDPAMTPVKRPGLVDLATHPSRSALVDFWCVKNSQFFMASDSGPYLLSWLFNVPCLALNITNVLGVFPLRHTDLYLIKRVQEAASGRPVPLSEMLTEEFLSTLRRRMYKDGALQYVDNDEDDIRSAVLEMVNGLQELPPPTPLQRQYRERIAQVRSGPLAKGKLHEKAGTDEVFLGEGRVSRTFVERHFHAVPVVGVDAQ